MTRLETPPIAVAETDEGDDGSLAGDVLDGLTREFKELPPKHLYDERGSRLFDEICTVEEYYPTRTERAILEARAGEIAQRSGATELVELGSGTAAKTRILLDAMRDVGHLQCYVPFDIDDSVVRASAHAIHAEYDGLVDIRGVVGDFEHHLHLIPCPPKGSPRLVALLGGTVGNFLAESRARLLTAVASLLRPGDHFLLGTDLVKDPVVIERAYNDARGVTAEFNLNVLRVINRELGADFDLDNFEHVAFFDPDEQWIEMRLRARDACHVQIPAIDLEVDFTAGEEMRTEISAKFTPERLAANLEVAGLDLVELYTDPDGLYGLALAAPSPPRESHSVRS